MSFCQDCFKGTLRGDAQLTGTVEQIHGLPTYVARPNPGQEPLALVVVIPDAYGYELLNTRALADAYARRGPFLVYVPDFMNGKAPAPTGLALMDKISGPSPNWLTSLVLKPYWYLQMAAMLAPLIINIRESLTRPRIMAFFRALRTSPAPAPFSCPPADLKIGVAGFCWGGRYTILLSDGDSCFVDGDGGEKRPLVDAAFTAHPSLVKIPGEVLPVTQPLSVANGEDDQWMGSANMKLLTQILEGKGATHEVVVYDGARHGFAVRGDPHDPRQAELGLRAEDQAVAWFRKQLIA